MEDLIQNPKKAEMIANNNVETFRERYLTQAAEACYWRALWEGWSQVSNFSKEALVPKGLRYESFLLLESSEMLQFSVPSPNK